jgi:hypothetical protein
MLGDQLALPIRDLQAKAAVAMPMQTIPTVSPDFPRTMANAGHSSTTERPISEDEALGEVGEKQAAEIGLLEEIVADLP